MSFGTAYVKYVKYSEEWHRESFTRLVWVFGFILFSSFCSLFLNARFDFSMSQHFRHMTHPMVWFSVSLIKTC